MSKEIPKQVIEEVLPVEETVEYADNINMDTQQWKDRVMRCKMICLHKLNLPLTTNPKYMGHKQKLELLRMIEIKILDTDDEIMTEFNDLVCDELLHQKADYSKYPTYNQPSQYKIVPVIPPIFQTDEKEIEYYEIDCGGNEIPMKDF